MGVKHQGLSRQKPQRLDRAVILHRASNYIGVALDPALGAMPLLDPKCASQKKNPK